MLLENKNAVTYGGDGLSATRAPDQANVTSGRFPSYVTPLR